MLKYLISYKGTNKESCYTINTMYFSLCNLMECIGFKESYMLVLYKDFYTPIEVTKDAIEHQLIQGLEVNVFCRTSNECITINTNTIKVLYK